MRVLIPDCDLGQIYRSGQCFRWREMGPGDYEIPVPGHCVRVRQQGQMFDFSCQEEEFDAFWRAYFDLDTDYGAIKAQVDPKDAYLTAAVANGGGMRILRQDVWEMILTFILSQNSNIPRIRKCLAGLCALYGGQLPAPGQLACQCEEALRALSLGYRAKYLCAAGAYFDGDALVRLRRMPYGQAHAFLRGCTGIGPKVADCICLFGLHHTDAFPIDTHIRSILAQHYPQGFPLERYAGCAGVLQQYMFFYDLQK